MKHTKKLVTLLLAVLMVAMLPTTATAMAPAVAAPSAPLSFTQVRLIQCLSSETNFPDNDSENFPLAYSNGWIFSGIPGITLIPASTAEYLDGFSLYRNDLPAKISIVHGSVNFNNECVLDGTLDFYPFRELAESLGYDVLWRNIDGAGYVFFAKHVDGGAWIHVSFDNLILPKSMNLDLSGIQTKDHGWMYANSVTVNGEYKVQFDKNVEVTIPSYWVTEVIPA